MIHKIYIYKYWWTIVFQKVVFCPHITFYRRKKKVRRELSKLDDNITLITVDVHFYVSHIHEKSITFMMGFIEYCSLENGSWPYCVHKHILDALPYKLFVDGVHLLLLAFSNQASYLWCPWFIHCSMPDTWMGVGILFPGCGDAQNFINDLLVEMDADAMASAAKDILESSNYSMMKYLIKMFEDKYNILLSIHIHLIGFIWAIKCSFIGLHNYTHESYLVLNVCVMQIRSHAPSSDLQPLGGE